MAYDQTNSSIQDIPSGPRSNQGAPQFLSGRPPSSDPLTNQLVNRQLVQGGSAQPSFTPPIQASQFANKLGAQPFNGLGSGGPAPLYNGTDTSLGGGTAPIGLGSGGPNVSSNGDPNGGYKGPDSGALGTVPISTPPPVGLGGGGPNTNGLGGSNPNDLGGGNPDINNIWKGPILGADPTGGNGGYVGPDSGNMGQINPALGVTTNPTGQMPLAKPPTVAPLDQSQPFNPNAMRVSV